MKIENNPESNQASTPASTPSLGEMSFSDYEAARRGGAKGIDDGSTQSAPEAKASEQKKSSVSDTEESDAKELDASEDEGEESESKEADSDKPKKKGGFQRRIDKLNSRVSESQREAEYWKAQALKGAGEPEPKMVDSKPATDDGKPNPETFDTHAEYVEALTDWKLEQRESKRDREARETALKAEQEKIVQTHTERVNAFKSKTKDFMDVIDNVADVPMSIAVQESIIQSELGPELMYELSKDPEEFERLNKLSPLAAAKAIGKIEARLSAEASPEKKTEAKKVTSAPKPLAPVGRGASGSVGKSIDDPNISFSDYQRLRREQLRKRRG